MALTLEASNKGFSIWTMHLVTLRALLVACLPTIQLQAPTLCVFLWSLRKRIMMYVTFSDHLFSQVYLPSYLSTRMLFVRNNDYFSLFLAALSSLLQNYYHMDISAQGHRWFYNLQLTYVCLNLQSTAILDSKLEKFCFVRTSCWIHNFFHLIDNDLSAYGAA